MVEFENRGGNRHRAGQHEADADAFGQKWDVDLKFAAPDCRRSANCTVAVEKPMVTEPDEAAKPAPKEPTARSSRRGKKKLALPKDATRCANKQLRGAHRVSSARRGRVAKSFRHAQASKRWRRAPEVEGKRMRSSRRAGRREADHSGQPRRQADMRENCTEGLDWSGGEDGKHRPRASPRTTMPMTLRKSGQLIKDAMKENPQQWGSRRRDSDSTYPQRR